MSQVTIEQAIDTLTPEAIAQMSYNELIGLVRETNRLPGGLRALQLVAHRLFLGPTKHVLEIGCATGWTSIELASLCGCRITAIDINPVSIAEARSRLSSTALEGVEFKVADAHHIPAADGSVDVVICGNVTSLVSDPERAMREYVRILKPGGSLVAVPMYYVSMPSDELLDDVRRAIRVQISANDRAAAIAPFERLGLAVHEVHDFTFDTIPPEQVTSFCEELLARPHLDALSARSRTALARVYHSQMQLFRRNLALMGFSVMILRMPRRHEDRELFLASVSGATAAMSETIV